MKTGRKIGIVGGGQLGRMLTVSAKQLGFEVTVVDPNHNSPAQQVGAKQILASLTDEKAIRELAQSTDILTFEIEHINTDILTKLADKGTVVHPSPKTLTLIKDKFAQKEFLRKNNISTSDFMAIRSDKDISKAAEVFGYPFMLKTRQGGYDGRGNALVKSKNDIKKAREKLGNVPLYAEKFVPFVKELAVMVARSTRGDIKTFPVVETIHKNNILHFTLAPAPIKKPSYQRAEKLARDTMKHLNGAGVFGIEMFLTKGGKILVNEIAPRIHNSGHYTIDACATSQFEQHIRAITGLPLGNPDMIVPAAVMINILGDSEGKAEPRGLEEALAIPGVYIHLYGKDPRPERKIGHITVLADNLKTAKRNAEKAREAISL